MKLNLHINDRRRACARRASEARRRKARAKPIVLRVSGTARPVNRSVFWLDGTPVVAGDIKAGVRYNLVPRIGGFFELQVA